MRPCSIGYGEGEVQARPLLGRPSVDTCDPATSGRPKTGHQKHTPS